MLCVSCSSLQYGECVGVASFESLFQLLETGTETLHHVLQLLVIGH